jgi:DNA-binding transcriptional MerR regulator
MLINEVAKKYNLSVRTLRYYEELGLIRSTRTPSNIRNYDRNQLQLLEQIILLKMLSLNLKDIQHILCYDKPDYLKQILNQNLTLLEENTYDLLYRQQLIRSLLKTYSKEDFSLKTISEFLQEQIYLKKQEEQMIHMLENTQNIVIEIGVKLIPLAVENTEQALIPAVKRLRTELLETYSLELDLIQIRDNEDLPEFEYRILQNGSVLFERTINNDLSFSAQVEQIITHLKSILI